MRPFDRPEFFHSENCSLMHNEDNETDNNTTNDNIVTTAIVIRFVMHEYKPYI